jgi:hypothetical protein
VAVLSALLPWLLLYFLFLLCTVSTIPSRVLLSVPIVGLLSPFPYLLCAESLSL